MLYQHILLIDDDVDDQEIFLTALQQVPDSPACSPLDNAKESLSQLRAYVLKPDVIFLDINMPIMNGLQFLREIKLSEKLKNIPVIMFSTSADDQTIKETERLGAKHFITKPGDFNDLKEMLKLFLNKSSVSDAFFISSTVELIS